MNYFELYPGDYRRDTADLPLAEHGAYLLLMMTYYASEQPLPAEFPALYRIAGAMTPAEQKAVRSVADRFFPMGEDGLRHNRRIDAELAKAAERMEGQAERRTNEAKRQRRHRARRAAMFEELRKLGVTPDFTASTADLEALLSRHKNVTVTRDKGVAVTRDATATRPQTPYTNKSSSPARASQEPTRATPTTTAAGRACLAMREAGCVQTNPSHPDLIAAIAEGVTPEALADTVREGLERTPPVTRPFTWAIATARGRREEGAKPAPAGEPHADDRPREGLADRAVRRLNALAAAGHLDD